VKGSRTLEIVHSFPPTAANYSKVTDSLKTMFGREELLIEKMLDLVVKNATSTKDSLSTPQLYDNLESYMKALESIQMTYDKYAAMLFSLVESCIPEEMLTVRLRNPTSSMKGTIDKHSDKLNLLLSFLRSEEEGQETISTSGVGPSI
jgi:hypothetical protein